MENKKYSIGLDIGTTSVGWAVVNDENYKLVKKGNKHRSLWGVRLFSEAEPAANRRMKRSLRRRYDRRRERINLLQDIFKDEINKVDNTFYNKLNDSFINPKDKNNKKENLTEFDKANIFNNIDHKKGEKECPTIYHLRNKIINSKEKEDIRTIYLAIHHIIKYRGHFTYNQENFNIDNLDIKECFNNIIEYIKNNINNCNENTYELNDEFYNKLEFCLTVESKTDKNKLTKDLLNEYNFDKTFSDEFSKLVCGNIFNINKMLNVESLEELKIKFSDTSYEDKYNEIEKSLGENIEIIDSCLDLYNILYLKSMFGNSKTASISQLMIDKYNKHNIDLKLLKSIIRQDKKIFKKFFKTSKEICIYEKYANNKMTYEDFIKEINKVLTDLEVKDNIKENILKDIDSNTFLPRITSTDNGRFPYQLNKSELIKIIENQGKYYDFLEEKVNINGKEEYKLVQLLQFRIPYYVGPLNTNTSTSGVKNKNAWLIKNNNCETIKITPFNFDQIIDKDKTAEEFIIRMTGNCTYLLDKKSIPNNSILYSKYKVLNELKQITIDDNKLSENINDIHTIYNELFLKHNGNITEKVFRNFLKNEMKYIMADNAIIKGYSDDKKFANNMQSYIDFFGENGYFKNTNYNIEDAEQIIKWITIFEDKDILERKLRKEYNLSEEVIKKLLKKKYTGWSNLSKELLTEVLYKDKSTNTYKSIIDLLWETKENFMQILNNKKYSFQEKISKLNTSVDNSILDYSLVEKLVTSPMNKKGIYQALKVVKELIDYMGYEPTNIVIEMARGEDINKSRKDSRKEMLKKLYQTHKSDISKVADYKKLNEELNKKDKIDSEKSFLYFLQLGKSLYSGEPIDYENINSIDYQVDHIIPQSIIKDDSLDNKALVLAKENYDKKDSLVLSENVRFKMKNWWAILKEKGLISDKKYKNLCRERFSDNDIEGFRNRQLVETRQICVHVKDILNSFYKKTNVSTINAELSSNYREKYELYKYRDLNDLHHAHDAYLAVTLGLYKNILYSKKTTFNFLEEIKELNKDDKHKYIYGYAINKTEKDLFDLESGELVFNADEFNKTLENTLYQNDVIISRKTEIKTDRFYKETILKSTDSKARFKLKNNYDVKLYGGYTETNISYMAYIEYIEKNKTKRKLIGIPVLLTYSNKKDELIKDYIENQLNIKEYKILKERIPLNIEATYKENPCIITGCNEGGCEIINNKQFKLDKIYLIKYKELLNFIFNNSYPYVKNMSKNEVIEKYNNIFDKQINEFFILLINKMDNDIKIFDNVSNKLKQYVEKDKFNKLSLINNEENKDALSKVETIKRIIQILKCNPTNADLKKLDSIFTDREGRLSGKNVNEGYITFKSVTGLKEYKYEL